MAEGTKLADAYVQIIPVAKGISNNLKELLGELPEVGEESGEKTGEGFASKLKSVIAKAGLTAAIGKVVQEAFTEGAALEQSLGGVETLFKEQADIVKKNAEEAYRTAGLSANEYMENVTSFSASLLSSLGGDTEKAAKIADMAMIDMSDNANKFGTDMSAIQFAYQGFAKQSYAMLDNLKLGYGGSRSEMERLLQDAEKFSKVKYDINNLNDVYEAIHVIQDNLDVTGTTAKEASSTFSGSFASMKAAAKNLLGVMTTGGDADKAFKNLTKTAEVFFGNVKRMGKAFINGAVTVFDSAVEEMLGKLGIEGEAAKKVVEGLHLAIKSATIAMIAFKTAAMVSKIKESMAGLTLEMIKGKLMAKAINAEMLITKGLAAGIAVGIGLVAASIINDMADAIDVTKDYDWEIHDLTEETKKFADQCSKTAAKVNDLHDEFSKSRGETESQADNYRTLISRMEELNKKTGRTKAEQAEFESIISTLNDEIPSMSLSIDSQTGSLKNNIDTVSSLADAYVQMEAGEDIMNKLAEAQNNAQEAEQAYADAVERRNAAREAGIDVLGDEYAALTQAMQEAHSANDTAQADLTALQEQLEATTEAQEDFKNGFGDINQAILNMSDSTLSGISDILDKYHEAYQTQHDLVFGQMNLLEEFCGTSDVTKETLEENLQDNINGFTEWESNLSVLRGKVAAGIISQDFYDNLKEMGPKGAGYAKAFVDMSDEELKQYSVKSKHIFDEMNDYVDRSMSAMKNESAQLLDDLIDLPDEKKDHLEEAYIMLGEAATGGYAEGIRNGSGDINDAVRRMIQESIQTVKSEAQIYSPSKVFAKLGGYVSEGYALGIEDEADIAARASADMVRQAINSANKANESISVSSVRQEALAGFPFAADSSRGMRTAFLEALAEYGSVSGGQSSRQPVQINVQVGKRILGKALINDINELTKLNGSSPLI